MLTRHHHDDEDDADADDDDADDGGGGDGASRNFLHSTTKLFITHVCQQFQIKHILGICNLPTLPPQPESASHTISMAFSSGASLVRFTSIGNEFLIEAHVRILHTKLIQAVT